jgi:UDP-glucose 4-epimerase
LGSTYLGKNKHFKLYGTDYLESDDGTAMRDFINVEDLAESHLAIINKIKNNGYYCYNVGTGKPISVKKLVDTFSRLTDKHVPIIEEPRRTGDQAIVYANVSLLKKDVDWQCSRHLDTSCQNFLNRCQYLEGLINI